MNSDRYYRSIFFVRQILYTMSFFGEMAAVLGLDEAKLALGYNYVNYNGEAVYIEGIKNVLRIGDEEMAFRLGKGVLYVSGTGLHIADLSGAAVLVRGEILSVDRIGGKEGKRRKAEKEERGKKREGESL